MKKLLSALICSAALVAAFSGCSSVQKDVLVSAEETQDFAFVADVESKFVFQDAKDLMGNKIDQKEISSLLKDINEKLKTPSLDKVIEARLYALKGRSYLLLKNKSAAESNYKEAVKKSAGDSEVLILGRRLGKFSIIEKFKDQDDLPHLITLEMAIENYQNSNFAVSSGLFDKAFKDMDKFYKDAYSDLRASAWQLKDVTPENSSVVAILALPRITIAKMFYVVQETTPEKIEDYTGEKKFSEQQLFKILMKNNLLASISAIEKKDKEEIKDISVVTKRLCARFLWNLYISEHKINGNKYSEKLRGKERAVSPVEDIDLFDQDFDAILGVVENEIMDLEDGVNFEPEKEITGAEFNGYLNNLK
ncbi:MAG: hypothetical protein K6B17_03700 [Treponema sp.]|nr:hypothetical protein [Treponema sp.]